MTTKIPFETNGEAPFIRLQNGAALIAFKVRETGVGFRESSWYVLANTGGVQPFVVWTVWKDGHCEWGHYFSEIVEAVNYFHAKAQ